MLVWKGAFTDPSGYGHAARGYLCALHEHGFDVRAFERKHDCMDVALNFKEQRILGKCLVKEVPGNADIIVHHCTPEFYQRHQNKYNIGYCAWETSKIPDLWVTKINENMDRMWVPCKHNKKVFRDSGVVRPVTVIPHGLDVDAFRPSLKKLNIRNLPGFVFLSVFQWTERKAWKTLLRSYFRAFRPEDDVALLLKVYRSNVSLSEQRAIKHDIMLVKKELGMLRTPDILFYGDLLPNELLPHLYNTCDCFVLPSRGEGFGLPLVEAMACGKSVITTNWSAMSDFVNMYNGYAVNYKLVPVQHMPHTPWYDGSQLWAEPDGNHLIALMREAFHKRKDAQAKGVNARNYVVDHYSWGAVAKQIVNEINSIKGQKHAKHK